MMPIDPDITHPGTLSMTVAAKPEMISSVRRSLAEHVRGLALPEDDVDAITLAVGEACSNAVCYGGKNVRDPKIIVTCLLQSPDRLQVEIHNQGNSFSPDLTALSALPSPEALASHGRGFALMSMLMDHVEVLSDGHNTIVRLIKQVSLS
jgi:anti-sigma regulatory factor (Ser/Thr protein kinase)